MWNFRSTFYIIETIPLIIHVALTSCLCVVRIFDGNINRNTHNRKTHVHSQFYAYQSTHSLILHFSSRASMHYHATLSEWARIEIIEWSKTDPWNARMQTFALREKEKRRKRERKMRIQFRMLSPSVPFLVADHQSVLRFNRYQINREIQLVI